MSDDQRQAVIRSMLLLELNSVFTKAYSHFAHYGDPEDRRYLEHLIELLKACLNEDATGDAESDIL